MDPGAIERLGERMRRSRAQEASIGREVAECDPERFRQVDCPLEQQRDITYGSEIE